MNTATGHYLGQISTVGKHLLLDRFWWLLVSLSLSACVQAPEDSCNSADKLLLAMHQQSIDPNKNFMAQAAMDLRDYLEDLGNAVPMQVDRALVFVDKEQATIAWFWQGCFIGQSTGPSAVLYRHA